MTLLASYYIFTIMKSVMSVNRLADLFYLPPVTQSAEEPPAVVHGHDGSRRGALPAPVRSHDPSPAAGESHTRGAHLVTFTM